MDIQFILCFVIWYCIIYFTVQLVPALSLERLLLPFDMNSPLQMSRLSAYKVFMIIRTYGQHSRIRNRLGDQVVHLRVRAYLD